MKQLVLVFLLASVALVGCHRSTSSGSAVDGGTDVDSDSDGDTDTASDTDVDSDTDTDTDADTDTDTDVDTDSDSDTDTDTETGSDSGSDTDTSTASDTDSAEATSQLSWAVQAGGIYFEHARGIDALGDGSSAVAGNFYSPTATFGLGEVNETDLTLTSSEGNDVFIARYDADGSLAWVNRAGGVDSDMVGGVAIGADESVYVVGAIATPATFGWEDTPSIDTVEGVNDAYVARFSGDGEALWAERGGGPNIDIARDVVVSADGAVVVAGQFRETITLDEGEPGEVLLEAVVGQQAMFLASYAEDGTLEWGILLGTLGNPESVALTADGDILVAGYYWDGCTFGPGQLGETTLAAGGTSTDVFVARLSPDGELDWVAHGGGPYQDHGYDVAALPDGSAVMVGDFGGTAVFGQDEPGETELTAAWGSEVFVAFFGADGFLTWATHAGGGLEAAGTGVGVTGEEAILVTGMFEGDATFGLGEANETILSADPSVPDMFLAMYGDDGSLSWAESAAHSGVSVVAGLALVEATDTVLLAGAFADEVTFGPGDPEETTLEALGLPGDVDVFVAAYQLP